MTTTPATESTPRVTSSSLAGDHRGSPIPTGSMIATRFMELRKRRGLMAALIVVFIGLPVIFLSVRLIAHGVDPKSYGPAGGYSTFGGIVDGALFVFGFIVAATLGCTAGSVDLTEGVFRHLVVTGRSRVALYLARIPAGLAILVPLVAFGFAIVCVVCCVAAPPKVNFDGVNLAPGLSRSSFVSWAESHPGTVVCAFQYRGNEGVNVPCGPNGPVTIGKTPKGVTITPPTKAQLDHAAVKIASQDYVDYAKTFRSPSDSLMIETGLWIELEAALGFVIGLGLASLMGQRTVPVVLMIILEVILTPLLLHSVIPHLINAQRGLVGLAMAHIEPSALPAVFGNSGNGGPVGVTESTPVAICVIIAWFVVWTFLGAWRMAKRDV
jgi:hypothetical protein